MRRWGRFPRSAIRQIRYGIERQDYSKNLGLLCRASLALSERLSTYSALRASNMAGDELRLLSLFGGQVYRLSDPTIQTPGHAFHVILTIVKHCFTDPR